MTLCVYPNREHLFMRFHFLNKLLAVLGHFEPDLDHIHVVGQDPILPCPFPIGEAGAVALAALGYLVAELYALKTQQRQQVTISVRDAAIAQRSHEYLRALDGSTGELWNPVSGFYLSQDGHYVQLHCNFPHHLAGVVKVLGCEPIKESVAQAVKKWPGLELETILAERGLCAALVRSPQEWQIHPQAKVINNLPLLEIIKVGESAAEPLPIGPRPLSGIRVLDLTRVIAGPVCGKTLAEHGATVLHLTSPKLPSILPLVMDTGFGKYSAHLDLDIAAQHETLTQLLQKADVFVQSYRPGGLAKRGFSPEECIARRPGMIYVSFSAYSHQGPWAERHGYDSLVQSATGFVYEQSQGALPRHLPAQTLDYLTGYFAALAVLEALRRRALYGGSYWIRLSLLQTAHWLYQWPRVTSDFSICEIPCRDQISSLLAQGASGFGNLEYLAPVLQLSKTPAYFERSTVPLGTHLPQWPKE